MSSEVTSPLFLVMAAGLRLVGAVPLREFYNKKRGSVAGLRDRIATSGQRWHQTGRDSDQSNEAVMSCAILAAKHSQNPMTQASGEFAYIEWLRRQTAADPRVIIGPGDDAAAITLTPGVPCLVTTDMLMEGTCFRLAEAGPRLVGRKAMAVNLSDIAAVAGQPVAAVVSVALPQIEGRSLAEALYLGMREVADEFNVAIVGGDTNSWVGPLVISVTVIGEATARGLVRRNGARPGDWLLVTGPLGGSIRDKHLTFTPRVREALQLHHLVDIHAMIDISDGLSSDVNHLCEESRCGAVLRASAIPIAADARLMQDHRSPLDHALSDGEDFELVLAVAPVDGQRLIQEQSINGVTLTVIGECVETGLWLEKSGQREPLEPGGYVHPLT